MAEGGRPTGTCSRPVAYTSDRLRIRTGPYPCPDESADDRERDVDQRHSDQQPLRSAIR